MFQLTANLRRWVVKSVAALVVVVPSAVFAEAVSPEILCVTPGSTAPTVDEAADAKVFRTARMAEDMIRADSPGPRTMPPNMLSIAMENKGEPSPAARASYCSAAGELARRGRYGTALDAPGFLLDAYLSAQQGSARDTGARAAYRLGLALATNPLGAVPVGRGGAVRGAGVRTLDMAATLLDTRSDLAACDTLAAGDPALLIPASVALKCAAQQATDAGDVDLAALARLRLARLLVSSTDKAPERAAALRAMAAELVVAGLGEPGRRPAPALTERLIETGLDAGEGAGRPVLQALSDLEKDDGSDVARQAEVAALRGRIALGQGRAPEAAEGFERAILLESRRATPTRMPDWYMLLAEAEPQSRAAHVHSAYVALERIRPFLELQDPITEESTYDLHMRAVFEAAVDDALDALPTTAAGSSQVLSSSDEARLKSAQGIIEAYREAELQNAFGNECISTVAAASKSRDLQKGEIILYPIVLRNRVEILLMKGGGGTTYQRLTPNTNYTRKDIQRLVASMRLSILTHKKQWVQPSRELYDVLIHPIENLLTDQSTLVIIPDSTLSGLPFAALSDASGKFLVERARLDIAPGLAYAQPGPARAGRRAFVLAGSLDRDMTLSFVSFARLDNAPIEASYATGASIGGKSRQGMYVKDFDSARLTDALERNEVDVLHLATHASFNGGSDRTFIVANGDFISLTNLSGMLSASRARGHPLDLLILSACETAVGDDKANLGLAGAAVQSGARSVIASLWQVNDESTSLLTKGFYDAYRGGAGKAEAMQASQLAMLRKTRFKAPYYWASLILVGSWR
jgi:CHAT domain-containing protein